MTNENAAVEAARAMGLSIPTSTFAAARQLLINRINDLLNHDFAQLVSLLYRLDIYETKLRLLLQSHPGTDAAELIANLIIERQAQKIKTREEYRQKENDIDDAEKW